MVRLRTRERSDLHTYTVPWHYVDIFGGVHSSSGSSVGRHWSRFETFSDVLSDPEDASVYRVHPCKHSSYEASHFALPRLTSYLGNYLDWDVPSFMMSSPTDELPSLFPGPTEADKASLAEMAFNALFQQMPQEVSVPNFVWELRELGDMIPKVEEGLAKTAAGGYLTYEFGYLPFVSDVTKLRNLAKTVADRLSYLRRTFGIETRVSCEGTFSVPAREAQFLGISGSLHRITSPSYTGHYRAGGYLYHRLNELYGVESTLRGFAGAMGLNNPVGVLWEATPYSFIADWFTRSKEVVNHLAVQPYTGVWEVRRLTHSFSWECVWDTVLLYDNGQALMPIPVESGTCKHYARGVGLPVSSSVFTQEGLSPRQQMLAAALAVAR